MERRGERRRRVRAERKHRSRAQETEGSGESGRHQAFGSSPRAKKNKNCPLATTQSTGRLSCSFLYGNVVCTTRFQEQKGVQYSPKSIKPPQRRARSWGAHDGHLPGARERTGLCHHKNEDFWRLGNNRATQEGGCTHTTRKSRTGTEERRVPARSVLSKPALSLLPRGEHGGGEGQVLKNFSL